MLTGGGFVPSDVVDMLRRENDELRSQIRGKDRQIMQLRQRLREQCEKQGSHEFAQRTASVPSKVPHSCDITYIISDHLQRTADVSLGHEGAQEPKRKAFSRDSSADDIKTFKFEGKDCPIGWTFIRGDVPSAEFSVEKGCLPDIRKAIDNASAYLKNELVIDFYETDEDDSVPIGTMTREIDGSWHLDSKTEFAEAAYNGNLLCFFFDTLDIKVDL